MLPSRLFFDDFLDDFEPPKKMEKMMKCDIYEEGNNYIIEMDTPGMKKEDINIEFEDGNLTISAEKKFDKETNKKYIHRERHSISKCSRSFYLGDVNEKDINAEFKNGILKISVPKNKKESNSKKVININ